jgi:hypothetical protein
MSTTPTAPVRPFDDAYLLAYSGEHLWYEIDMFWWLARVFGNPQVRLGAPSEADGQRLSNALNESCTIHVRNLIDFLYLDIPRPTDVVAADFFKASEWAQLRPGISPDLDAARVRANKEVAHLTTQRMADSPPEKKWDIVVLASELRPVLQLFATNALPTRLSGRVTTLLS